MADLRDIAIGLQALAATVAAAAQAGDGLQLAGAAEELLLLRVDFARAYRRWLSARTAPWVPAVRPDAGSDSAYRCST